MVVEDGGSGGKVRKIVVTKDGCGQRTQWQEPDNRR